jgi:hypothetical protein
LEDRRNGGSSCNSGDGTDQRVQSLMSMMMTNTNRGLFFNWNACLSISAKQLSIHYVIFLSEVCIRLNETRKCTNNVTWSVRIILIPLRLY